MHLRSLSRLTICVLLLTLSFSKTHAQPSGHLSVEVANPGPVTIELRDVNRWTQASGSHLLEYEYGGPGGALPRGTITVSARGIPEQLSLRASARTTPDGGEGRAAVSLGDYQQTLITGITAHPVHGLYSAEIHFEALASAPFPSSIITVVYTFTN